MKRRIGDFLLEDGRPWTKVATHSHTGEQALCAKRWCETEQGQFDWQLVQVTAVSEELINVMNAFPQGNAIIINRSSIYDALTCFGQLEFERELAVTDPMLSLWPTSLMQDDVSPVAIAASPHPVPAPQQTPAQIAYASLTPAEIQAAHAQAAAVVEATKTRRIRESWATVVARHNATAEVKPSAWDAVVARHQKKAA
jgi:hypothetical protein